MKYAEGIPWLRFENHLPRLFLHEKHERIIKWALRGLTAVGIISSLVTLPWYYSLFLAVVLVIFDALLERTLFYYTSMYVQAMPDFKYDPQKWVANVFVSLGHPTDPESQKIVGLVFNEEEYARKLFALLRAWNHGYSDNKKNNFCLSFITDQDKYYVYLYPSFEKATIQKMHEKLEDENKLKKYGKEHFGLIVAMIICRGFNATRGYALGTFTDNHPVGKPFLLSPFIHVEREQPQLIDDIEPIRMYRYKAKRSNELTEDDFEYIHWNKVVQQSAVDA